MRYMYKPQVIEDEDGKTEFQIDTKGKIYDRDGGRGIKKVGVITKKGQLILNDKYAKRFPLQVKRLVRILKEASETE